MKLGTTLLLILGLAAGGCAPGARGDDDDENHNDNPGDVDGGATGQPCTADFPTRCVGAEYQVCVDGFYEVQETCGGTEVCSSSLGCVACDPQLQFTCQNDDSYKCNADGTIGDL